MVMIQWLMVIRYSLRDRYATARSGDGDPQWVDGDYNHFIISN